VTVASGIFVVGLARAPELVAFRDSAPTALASVAVPAVQPTNSALPIAAKAVLTSFRPKQHSRSIVPQPIQATLAPPQPAEGSLAKATLATSKQDAAAPQTVFVVMRTEQFGPSGASWTIRVWRFTVLKPEQIPVELNNPAKSL
jgi:hypothetical protein